MSAKILKTLIYIAGAVCLFVFVAIRHPALFNAVLYEKIVPEYWENTKYGELYYFNFIRHFREKNLPPSSVKYRFTEKHPTLEEADMLLFGDSFFDFTRLTTFPEQLGDTLKKRTFYARMDRPLEYLAEQDFHNDREMIILYESAERYIPFRFTEPHSLNIFEDHRSPVRRAVAEVRDYLFLENAESLYQTMLKRSYLTTGPFSMSATLKFDVFGYISTFTPKYSLDHNIPWLFYYDQVNEDPGSFYYHYSEEEIDNYCNNIADLATKLKENYNLTMVFMGIPSKYTINHNVLNNDHYNDFLPKLNAGLEERGIPFIPLYEDYHKSEDLLYFGTDTHWNAKGQKIALERTVEVLKSF